MASKVSQTTRAPTSQEIKKDEDKKVPKPVPFNEASPDIFPGYIAPDRKVILITEESSRFTFSELFP